jgi:hypothetical protein
MTGSGDWEVEFYADEAGREPCRAWMEKLPPTKRIALEVAIQLVLARRGPAVVETEFGKALGGGLYEFRLRWSAEEVRRKVVGVLADGTARPEKILPRVFFCTSSGKIILLLGGYDKAKDPASGARAGRSPRRASCWPRTRRPSAAADGRPGRMASVLDRLMCHDT